MQGKFYRGMWGVSTPLRCSSTATFHFFSVCAFKDLKNKLVKVISFVADFFKVVLFTSPRMYQTFRMYCHVIVEFKNEAGGLIESGKPYLLYHTYLNNCLNIARFYRIMNQKKCLREGIKERNEEVTQINSFWYFWLLFCGRFVVRWFYIWTSFEIWLYRLILRVFCTDCHLNLSSNFQNQIYAPRRAAPKWRGESWDEECARRTGVEEVYSYIIVIVKKAFMSYSWHSSWLYSTVPVQVKQVFVYSRLPIQREARLLWNACVTGDVLHVCWLILFCIHSDYTFSWSSVMWKRYRVL